MELTFRNVLVCPACKAKLTDFDGGLVCKECGNVFDIQDGILEMDVGPSEQTLDRRTWYLWSDLSHFEDMLRPILRPGHIVVEVCSGPNIVVPHLLHEIQPECMYISVGRDGSHLKMQRSGAHLKFLSVKGDTTALMLDNGCADMVVFHHAINDIWLSRGIEGICRSLDEAARVVRDGGVMIFSHCEMDWDPSTKEVSLDQVKTHLERQRGYSFEASRGPMQDWLLVRCA
jgi:Trm112p-like protein